ncbi:hypothetical protein [Streptomyces sp. enrichment culture]|uniref:hypothetical protein n=1 Tax=Streptomyces sp. enrichment culture TaxID=1795815 RepID=UPI003F565159
MADDPALRELMDAVSAKIGAIGEAEDRQLLVRVESEFEHAVRAFLEAAAQRIR